MKKKKISINLSQLRPAGLSHQLSNLIQLIKYAYHNNFSLTPPLFKLTGKHNRGNEICSNLSDYFNFNDIRVEGKKYLLCDGPPSINSISLSYTREKGDNDLLINHSLFSELPDISVEIPTHPSLKKISNKVRESLNHYTCVHVRRSDRSNQTKECTKPSNILKNVEKFNCKKVYIMTDAKKLDFFKPLINDKNFDFFFAKDFDFYTIKDNYKVFLIEQEIMKLASYRISCLRWPSWAGYDSYLCKLKHWNWKE